MGCKDFASKVSDFIRDSVAQRRSERALLVAPNSHITTQNHLPILTHQFATLILYTGLSRLVSYKTVAKFCPSPERKLRIMLSQMISRIVLFWRHWSSSVNLVLAREKQARISLLRIPSSFRSFSNAGDFLQKEPPLKERGWGICISPKGDKDVNKEIHVCKLLSKQKKNTIFFGV